MKKFTHKCNPPKIVLWYMRKMGYTGLTTFWGVIYYDGEENCRKEWLRRHEMKHEEQMNRDGLLWFHIKYGYYWIKYGYWNNPYEVEARAAEKK